MWRVLLSLVVLFAIGRTVLFFLNRLEPKERFSWTEVALYSFSLGYGVLSIIGTALAQFGLLTPLVSLLVISTIPILAICFWIHERRKEKPRRARDPIHEDRPNQELSMSKHGWGLLSSIGFSHIALLLVLAVGIVLRLETQLTVPWLGDQDPYYHLSFIESIVAQGTLPSRTFWGSYSYPPSFHVVFAMLISTIEVNRYTIMKIVPEFLGFLCIPAVYVLIKRKYNEWAGIASAAFLSICSYHIYRTNIAIPEPIALLAMLMFFLAVVTHTGAKKYLLAGFFASIVFLTNVIGILYFLPCVGAIFLASLALKRWDDALSYLKSTCVGLLFSGVFWLPTLYRLGLNGIFEGLGPAYPYPAVTSYTSHIYFSWIGWGACVLAFVGAYICIKDFRNSLVLIIPPIFFLFLIEAANNGYLFFDANVIFRGLLFLGTWVSLMAGAGFSRLIQTKRKKIAVTALAIMVVLTMVSFPVFSGERYPVNWGYEDADFVYRSYLENYANVFKDKNHMIYCTYDYLFNYGAFNNVILDREAPQIREALLRNESSTFMDLINEYNIKYLIFHSGTQEAEFLIESNLTYTYYEDSYTTVLVIK